MKDKRKGWERMEVLRAVVERRSIRKFRSEPVERALLGEILQAAVRAPSAINTQPWECWVVGGKTLGMLSQEIFAEAAEGRPHRSDFELQKTWKEPFLNRMRDNGKGLFGLLGIERHDKEKKEAFSLSMYRFFDAPQVIFVCLDASLGAYAVFDCGGFVQTICLLATAKGLGTCIQHSGVNYPDIIRKYVPIPEEKEILVAIAIGYPDEEAMVNRFRSNREPLENVVHWMDLA
jgi:nitroreductase